MEILNGMLIELNAPRNANFKKLVILNKNAKNKSGKFAKLCVDEFLTHNKVDTATIENFETCYNNTVENFGNRMDYAHNIEQQSTQNFWYNTATSSGEFGDKDSPTLFIIYENYKKVFEKLIIYDESAFKINLDIDITPDYISVVGGSTSYFSTHFMEYIDIKKMQDNIKTIKKVAKTQGTRLRGLKAMQDLITQHQGGYTADYTAYNTNFNACKEAFKPLQKIGYVKSNKEIKNVIDNLPNIRATKSMEVLSNIDYQLNTAVNRLTRQLGDSRCVSYAFDFDID